MVDQNSPTSQNYQILEIVEGDDIYYLKINNVQESSLNLKITQPLNPYYWQFHESYEQLISIYKNWSFFGSAIIVSQFIIDSIKNRKYTLVFSKQNNCKLILHSDCLKSAVDFVIELTTKFNTSKQILMDQSDALYKLSRKMAFVKQPFVSKPVNIIGCNFHTISKEWIGFPGTKTSITFPNDGIYYWEILISGIHMNCKNSKVALRLTLKNKKDMKWYFPNSSGGIIGVPNNNYTNANYLGKNQIGKGEYSMEMELKILENSELVCSNGNNSQLFILIFNAN